MEKEWSVIVRKWSYDDEPGVAETKEFNPMAEDEEEAKEKAIDTAKEGISSFIDDWEDEYDILECGVAVNSD